MDTPEKMDLSLELAAMKLFSERHLSIDILEKMKQITKNISAQERHKRVEVLYKIVQRSKDEQEMERHLKAYREDLGITE